jgi:hypothetical protein
LTPSALASQRALWSRADVVRKTALGPTTESDFPDLIEHQRFSKLLKNFD